jgi:hypothetical protein
VGSRSPRAMAWLDRHLVREGSLNLSNHRIGFDKRRTAREKVQPVHSGSQDLLCGLHHPRGVGRNYGIVGHHCV